MRLPACIATYKLRSSRSDVVRAFMVVRPHPRSAEQAGRQDEHEPNQPSWHVLAYCSVALALVLQVCGGMKRLRLCGRGGPTIFSRIH